jgi:hypothetical protein
VLAERARTYASSSKAANTPRAYQSDLRHSADSARPEALDPFPAGSETVALYLVDHAERLACPRCAGAWRQFRKPTRRLDFRT